MRHIDPEHSVPEPVDPEPEDRASVDRARFGPAHPDSAPGGADHVDADVIALLALGEPIATNAEISHLAQCHGCSEKLGQLVGATAIGRTALDFGPLVEPSPRVWAAIHDELGLSADVAPAAADTRIRALHDTDADPTLPSRSLPTTPFANSTDRAGLRQFAVARLPRRALVGIAAAVVGLISVGGAIGWQSLTAPRDLPPQAQVLAKATLDAFPSWAGATGTAVVEKLPGATRELRVAVEAPAEGEEFREVWLITSDASDLVSLGVLEGATGTFAIPDGIDLGEYQLVDVSQEARDGNPAHSGDSIMRGALS